MSIPKKGSRRIVVDGVTYRWLIRRRPTTCQRRGETSLKLGVSLEDGGGSTLVVERCGAHPSNEARLRSQAVTPGGVAAWIRAARSEGWQPHVPGRQFRFAGPIDVDGPITYPRGLAPKTPSELAALAQTRQRDALVISNAAPNTPYPLADIRINGVELIELAKRAELPHTEGSGDTFEPGAYMGMHLSEFMLPSRALLDQPEGTTFKLPVDDPRRTKATVLSCTCGNIDCWFLLVRVSILQDVVIWSEFEQFHRAWIYDLGPFVFDKAEYMRALQQG